MGNVRQPKFVLRYLFEQHLVGQMDSIWSWSLLNLDLDDQSTSDSGDPSKMTNGLRSQEKGKTSPLMNSTKFTKPLRSTTSVVKNMMGAGATLVYDSVTTDKTPPSPTTSTNPLLSYPYYPNHHHHQQQQQHRKEQHALQQDKLVQNLKKNLTQHSTNNNSTPILTGRSWQSDSLNHSSTISTETITTKNHHDSVSVSLFSFTNLRHVSEGWGWIAHLSLIFHSFFNISTWSNYSR